MNESRFVVAQHPSPTNNPTLMPAPPILAVRNAPARFLLDLLDDPDGHSGLTTLQNIDPHSFADAIAELGLEDAAGPLAAATTEQTVAVLDEVAFQKSRDAFEPNFDPLGFARWLEVMLEWGDGVLARRLIALPETLVTAGFCGQFFVVDLESMVHAAGAAPETGELADRLLESSLYLELEQHTLVARHELTWDVAVAALLALDRIDHDYLSRLLTRCRQATRSLARDDTDCLEHILSAHEMIDGDAIAEREDRREAAGYVTFATACSFLGSARQTSLVPDSTWARDASTHAYFRAQPPTKPEPEPGAGTDSARASGLAALTSATGEGARPEDAQLSDFRDAWIRLSQHDPARWSEQAASLGYLANLMATHQSHDRDGDLRLEQLGRDILDCCARGLGHARVHATPARSALEALASFDCDVLFRIGWRLGLDDGRGPVASLE